MRTPFPQMSLAAWMSLGCLISVFSLGAQELAITDIRLDADHHPVIRFTADPEHYDVYELERAPWLHPLRALDAFDDFDADYRTNLDEYRRGTDPFLSDIRPPTVGQPVSATASTILQLTGTATPGGYVRVEGGSWWATLRDLDLSQGGTGNLPPLTQARLTVRSSTQTITGGGDHTVALQTNGSLWVWGSNAGAQLGISPWRQVAGGAVWGPPEP